MGARRRRTKSRSDAVAFTIPAISSTKTPAQIKANYVALMGPQAGEAFAELMPDAARLHLKWNEFLALFAVGPAQIDTLNKAAPGFFYLVSGVVERPNPAHLPYDRRQQEGPVARDPHEAFSRRLFELATNRS